MPPPIQEKEAATPLSKQRLDELSERCGNMSREQFRRAWKDGTVNAGDGQMSAEFRSHYNAQLDTCFYLLTVASAGALKKMLFDINGGELYGEYQGPANIESPSAERPKACRVESLYCASRREWEVLVEPYMQE